MKRETNALKSKLNKKSKDRRQRNSALRSLKTTRARPARNDLCPDISVEWVDTDKLIIPKNHPRTIDPDHLDEICRSIKYHGFIEPVLTRNDVVLDGATRLEACKQLGLSKIRCLTLDNLTDLEAKTYALASNRLSEKGEWNLDNLRLEIQEIITLDGDITVTGFSAQEADIILLDEGSEKGEIEPQIPDALDNVVVKVGDGFVLGDHRLLCGDALKKANYKKLLGDEVVDLVATDVPYNVPISNNVSGLGKTKHGEFVQASGEMTDDEFTTFLITLFTIWASLIPKGSVIFSFIDWRGVEHLIHAGKKAGLKLINMAVWNKGSGAMGGFLRSAHELVPIFCKGKHPKTNNVQLGRYGRDRTNVWDYPGANRKGSSAADMLKDHPTPKNLEMMEDAILDVTGRGDIVLDPFLGCGTTLIACETQGRICRAIELDPKYVDVSIRRWEEHMGRDAVHEASGLSYSELAEARTGGDDVPGHSPFGCFDPF